MRQPTPITAINCEDGKHRHFASISEACRKLGMASTYACRRVNGGQPCKGWLLFDDDHATSPEAVEAQRRHVKGYETKMQAMQARKDTLVSIRIDSRTTILVKASKWTPDYAERYRETLKKRNEIISNNGDNFRKLPSVKKPKRGPGRPRKEVR